MCDYSLESYQSRPAVKGEEYVSHQFRSGSIGFVSPADPDVAICMSCGTQLELTNLPKPIMQFAELEDSSAVVTFTKLGGTGHKDAVCFANGRTISLQTFSLQPEGVRARIHEPAPVVEIPPDPKPATQVRERVLEPA